MTVGLAPNTGPTTRSDRRLALPRSALTESECAWGEIDHEILTRKDCTCLYGCPYIPLSKETVERRAQQHAALCNPREDGDGKLCGVDDCATPGALACNAGACEAAPAAMR